MQEHNPYLDELKVIRESIIKTAVFRGVSRKVVEVRRARNYRARASRRLNRLRAKGK